MLKTLCCLCLLSSGVCLAGDPSVRPPLPTFTPEAAEPAVVQPADSAAPATLGTYPSPTAPVAVGTYPPPPGHPGGVWYRPEAVVPPANDGLHLRYPYYSYRRPWYPAGPASVNVTIIW